MKHIDDLSVPWRRFMILTSPGFWVVMTLKAVLYLFVLIYIHATPHQK